MLTIAGLQKYHVLDTDTQKTLCGKFIEESFSPVCSPEQPEFYCKKCLASGYAPDAYRNYQERKFLREEIEKNRQKKWNNDRLDKNDDAKALLISMLHQLQFCVIVSDLQSHDIIFGSEANFKSGDFSVKITVNYPDKLLR